jgi:hypothetical protein
MIDPGEAIGNGLASVEHVLERTPATLDEVNAKLDAFIERSEGFMERIEVMLDGFEEFANGPVGKLMLKRAKGSD